ncbi:MAG: methylenetetrahydrofolate reductase C-terminal domain-containing protein [Hyphomicrobiales bacterium]|nr:methylenetetrahydrofolate reductase C-terminal domain-containing protein [Hyphomicrobiales bacterium]
MTVIGAAPTTTQGAPGFAPRYRRRLWSVRHARGLAALYRAFERSLRAAAPLVARIGAGRLERPVAAVERRVKGALFDCKMCGQCVLSRTGLSCPTNCPKGLRNGPCGGVRADGACEVVADMPCVWVQAFDGARRIDGAGASIPPLPPVDNRLLGRSSWLAVARDATTAAP